MPTEAGASFHVHKPRQTDLLTNASRKICILFSVYLTGSRSSFTSIQVALQRPSTRNSISAKCQVGRWLANSNGCIKYIPLLNQRGLRSASNRRVTASTKEATRKAKVEKPSALPLSKAISGCTVAADERSSEPRGVPVSRLHPHAPPLSCSLAHSHSLFWCTPLPSNR